MSARAGVVGVVVGAFNVGDLLGWVAFWNTTSETVSSAHKRGELAARRVTVDDLQGLKIACGYLAVTVVGVFVYGAWLKFDNRRRDRKNYGNASLHDARARNIDAAWRWMD